MNFLRLRALAMPELGLLLLRAALGGSLLLNHGIGKLMKFSEMSSQFHDPLGIGPRNSLCLAIFAEVLCAALLVVGFLSRFAALSLAIMMGIAFFMVHRAALSGAQSGELAFLYLIGFVSLVFTGPGRWSVEGED